MTEENVEMTRGEHADQAWGVMGAAGLQHLERVIHLTLNASNAKRTGMVAHFHWQSKDQAPFLLLTFPQSSSLFLLSANDPLEGRGA